MAYRVKFNNTNQSLNTKFQNTQTINGLSAYEVAVKNGFEGSEQEWLESLKGEPGVAGKDGYTPVKGKDYFDGKDGQQGAAGKDGYTPVKGKDYFDGADGRDGQNGVSPNVTVQPITGGNRVTITDANGTKTFDVMNGEPGEPGVNAENDELFIVRYRAGSADKTYREIMAAAEEKRALLLIETISGEVYPYAGRTTEGCRFAKIFANGVLTETKENCFTVSSSDKWSYTTKIVNARNPYPIRLTGAVNAEYDGSTPVTVNIPEGGEGGTGLPTGGEPHQMLVTDAEGNAKWEERTHYTAAEEVTVLPEGVYTVNPDMGAILFPEPLSPSLVDGGRYTVVIEGETFNSTAAALTFDGMDIVLIGNPAFIGAGADNEEPYMMLVFVDENIASVIGGYGMFVCAIDATSVTLKVTGNAETVKKIPEKFIPDPKNGFILNGSQLGSLRTLLSEVEGEDYTIGYSAFAVGEETRASGTSSHAEGRTTTASGDVSHAEGTGTIAGGLASHAEGDGTTASGDASHAEGSNTTASGWMAHAEGYSTVASGSRSHAEGRDTIAKGAEQHAQGKYNVEDTANKYAHIVGNGTADNKRSNAHTIDWDGNAWFAGTVEGTALILTSPDGSRWQITVDNTGALATAKL